MADGTLDSQVGARICNGLGIMRACLKTQKLEQLESRPIQAATGICFRARSLALSALCRCCVGMPLTVRNRGRGVLASLRSWLLRGHELGGAQDRGSRCACNRGSVDPVGG
jgi:hypothetical protein